MGLDELNESQQAAVLYNDGPSLVIAGAGSGKTRVLTYKVAYLLESGLKPWSVLALTFTNKAAREMKERIARQVGMEQAGKLWMGTFHSIFLRILHAEAQRIGFSSHFTVYDSADSKSLVRSILKEMKLDEKVYKPGVVLSRISGAKNRLISPDAYASNREAFLADQAEHIPLVRDIYARYMARCRMADAMDFDDLLYYTHFLFQQFPEVLALYQERFQYILVDEYQDTNLAQHAIVQQLAAIHHRVCVVGDDAQSIYSFRGAEIDNILNFSRTFPETKIFKLEQNYRSTKTIVQAANSLIEKNSRQIQKAVFSMNARGERIPVMECYSDMVEATEVVGKISELHRREQHPYTDFAILYRTNAQSRVFEEMLRKMGVPYCIYGGLSFYQRKEIKDIISYFRLVVNPRDEEALKRVINYPARGIGETTVGKLTVAASTHAVSLWNVLESPQVYDVKFNGPTSAKLKGFSDLIQGWRETLLQQSAYEAGVAIIKESGIYQELSLDRTPEGQARVENVEELVNGLKDFCAQRQEEGNDRIFLTDYLSEVSLLSDQDTDEGESNERVTLMTVHSAKGLEFPVVFVVGMEEHLFPGPRAADSPRALEEERRLFYVAITRAEKRCFFSYAKMRYRYGKMEFSTPSRFLRDIDSRFMDWGDTRPPFRTYSQEVPESFAQGRSPRPSYSRPGETDYHSSYSRPGETDRRSSYSRPGETNRSSSWEDDYRQGGGSDSAAAVPPAGMKRVGISSSRSPFSGASSSGTSSSGTSSSGASSSGSPSSRSSFSGTSSPRNSSSGASSVTARTAARGLNNLQVGDLIEHERFGIGEVMQLSGQGDDAMAVILFRQAGTKRLLLRFARFKVISNG